MTDISIFTKEKCNYYNIKPQISIITNGITTTKKNGNVIDREDTDCRFMDSYDHLMTLLVNQTESDIETEIQSPVRIDKEKQEGQISNNWYKD